MDVVFDGMAALDAHQGTQFVLAARSLDIGRRKGHHHTVGMPRRLFIDRIDQIEGVFGEVPLVGFWIDPDGKELGTKIAVACLVEADMADVVGIGRANVEAFVKKSLWRVSMRIDYQSGIVNGMCFGTDATVSRFRLCSLCCCERACQQSKGKQSDCHSHGPRSWGQVADFTAERKIAPSG